MKIYNFFQFPIPLFGIFFLKVFFFKSHSKSGGNYSKKSPSHKNKNEKQKKKVVFYGKINSISSTRKLPLPCFFISFYQRIKIRFPFFWFHNFLYFAAQEIEEPQNDVFLTNCAMRTLEHDRGK